MKSTSLNRQGSAIRQAALYLAAYLVYGLSRWLVTGDPSAAGAHAQHVFAFERHLGVAVEPAVQGALSGGPARLALNLVYVAAQVGVVPLTLLIAYRTDRRVYRRLRDVVLVTWLIAVPVFWLFPVAPPRLAHLGFTDTLATASGAAINSRLATSLYNPLAAMPSLHCGFALAVSLALYRLSPTRALKIAALGWTPLVILAVVATGNHFVLDAAAGLATTLAGAAIVTVPGTASRRRPRRLARTRR